MSQLPKLMVMGYGRHGKDTVCDMFHTRFGFTSTSSSWEAAATVILPKVRSLYDCWDLNGSYPANKPSIPFYNTVEECFEDRHTDDNRAFWFDTIVEAEQRDAVVLTKTIFGKADIYCGVRNKRAFHAAKNQKLFDYSIWVDRSDHLPPEDRSSCTVEQWMADYTIDNNGSLAQLYEEVERIGKYVMGLE